MKRTYIDKIILGIIVIWSCSTCTATLPPDPDNAALLYYQAILVLPESDTDTNAALDNVLDGEEPNQKIRDYLDHCKDAFTYVEEGSTKLHCNWGTLYSKGPSLRFPQAGIHQIALLLEAEVLIKTGDGNYKGALNRCMTLYRFAEHIGNDTELLHLLSMAVESVALNSIQHVLGNMPPEQETLLSLRSQLASFEGNLLSSINTLEIDLERIAEFFGSDPNQITWIRQNLVIDEDLQPLTDEELLLRETTLYSEFFDEIFRVIDSEMPYNDTYHFIEDLVADFQEGPIFIGHTHQSLNTYSILVRLEALRNATKTATEIYLILAETGQLPVSLPPYLPKDPFSGQDFEYEIVDGGFILRCRSEDLGTCPSMDSDHNCDHEIHEYSFNIVQN